MTWYHVGGTRKKIIKMTLLKCTVQRPKVVAKSLRVKCRPCHKYWLSPKEGDDKSGRVNVMICWPWPVSRGTCLSWLPPSPPSHFQAPVRPNDRPSYKTPSCNLARFLVNTESWKKGCVLILNLYFPSGQVTRAISPVFFIKQAGLIWNRAALFQYHSYAI